MRRAAPSSLALGLLAPALALFACTADYAANPAPRCEGDADCASGAHCHRGFCVGGTGGACDVEGQTRSCSERGEIGLIAVGACRPGSQRCVGGAWSACDGEIAPTSPDACDGVDQDCDNRMDEDLPDACEANGVGVCSEGMPGCASGSPSCVVVNEPDSRDVRRP